MIIDMLALASDDKSKHKPIRLVSPAFKDVPEESLLSFELIEKLEDLFVDRPLNAVLMISEDDVTILECWAKYNQLFDREAVVLTGVPGLTYSPEFESVAFSLEKVAYHSVVSDLVEAARREASMTEEEKASSIIAKEQAGFTRSNGTVKEFKAFDAPNMPLGHVDLEAEGEDVLGDETK